MPTQPILHEEFRSITNGTGKKLSFLNKESAFIGYKFCCSLHFLQAGSKDGPAQNISLIIKQLISAAQAKAKPIPLLGGWLFQLPSLKWSSLTGIDRCVLILLPKFSIYHFLQSRWP